MVRQIRKIVCVCLFAVVAAAGLTGTASAQNYSTDYPNIYNSGSPLWLHCNIEGLGEYVIVIDPNTNVQSFAFDGPRNRNLINNSGSTIYGRAYDINSTSGYNVRWVSYYKLQLQMGTNNYGQTNWVDYDITEIYGTTLDLIDYNGTRGNDNLTTDERILSYEFLQTFLLCVIGLCMLIRPIFKFVTRSRA